MRSLACSLILSLALLVAPAAATDEEDKALQPDETDFFLIKSCLDAVRNLRYPETEHCIGLVTQRCYGMHLPILRMQCDERERHAWQSLMNSYFDSLVEHNSKRSDLVVALLDAHKNWIDHNQLDCDYYVGRWDDGTISQKEASFRCSRDAYAARALQSFYFVSEYTY